MNAQPKKKWKLWHKITLGVILLILFGIGKLTSSVDDASKAEHNSLSQFQKDSTSREDIVKKAFSAWDGSQTNLVKFVKQNMNDPKSFEHVETRYWDNGKSDTIVIKMTYRGKNAFGGVVTERVRATAKLDGELISVNEE